MPADLYLVYGAIYRSRSVNMIELIVRSLIIGTIVYICVYFIIIRRSSNFDRLTKLRSFLLYLIFIGIFLLFQLILQKIW